MIELTFWGVRGTNPTCGSRYERIGGHTSCVTVRVGHDSLIILDAGSGLYDLGQKLKGEGPQSVNMLISHPHLDHLMGFPFFEPVWSGHCRLSVHSSNSMVEKAIRDIILKPPLFPVGLQEDVTKVDFHEFVLGADFHLGQTRISTILLNHPGGSTGYRLQANGTAICYITDVEHDPQELDEQLVAFVRGCTLLIYDAAYTQEEYERKRGWGHSTNIRAAEIAAAAGVGQLALFHQDPSHDDEVSDQVVMQARILFPNTFAARQGMTLVF
jgi:ribonuclease BN (tRNA processing enzyme)